MFELSPLTTMSGRPLHYGNAYLTQESVLAESETGTRHFTRHLRAVSDLDWCVAEHWLRVAGPAAEAA